MKPPTLALPPRVPLKASSSSRIHRLRSAPPAPPSSATHRRLLMASSIFPTTTLTYVGNSGGSGYTILVAYDITHHRQFVVHYREQLFLARGRSAHKVERAL